MKTHYVNLETLIKQCRGAALGDLPWDTLLSNICKWVEGDRAMMMHASHGQPYSATYSVNHDLSVLAKYNENYNGTDPRMPFSKLTPPGHTRTGQQYLPNSEIENTKYFNTISKNTNILDSVHSVIVDSPEIGRQAISIHRGFENEFFQKAHVERMQALLPHLTDAYEYAIRVAGQFTPESERTSASILVNQKLQTHILNGKLSNVLIGCEDLMWNGEFLRPKTDILKQFIFLAIQRANIGGLSNCRIQVSDPLISEIKPYIQITILPCPNVIDWLPDIKNKVMFHICRHQQNVDTSNAQIFYSLYSLTKAECRTLDSLLTTRDLKQASKKIGISYETSRWHLKNIYQKTGLSTQDTLLRAISEMDLSRAL